MSGGQLCVVMYNEVGFLFGFLCVVGKRTAFTFYNTRRKAKWQQKTQKETKAILKAFRGEDISAVKAYLDEGVDPNEVQILKYGNIYDADNPYTLYDVVLNVQVWYLDFIQGTKKIKEQQSSLEIVKLLTPLVKSAYPLADSKSYLHRALPRSFDRLDLDSCNQYKKPGMYDELLNAMLETGYDFASDKDVFWKLGMFGFETAKKVLAITGLYDGASVFSAAENHHTELLEYLLAQGVSSNKPHQFSNGSVSTALHEAIQHKNVVMIKALLNAGADTTVKNGYNHDCFESAKVNKLDSDIVALMEK